MPQIATTIASHPYERLRRLAHQGQVSYGTVIERALLAYAPAESPPAPDVQVIQAALEPVLLRLAALETRVSEIEGREVRSALELMAALEGVTARLAALEGLQAPMVADADAEAVSEVEPAENALPEAPTAMPESVPDSKILESPVAMPESVRVFAELSGVERAKAVAAMRDMRRRGLSYKKIGLSMFQEHGVATDSHKPLWPGTVQNILDGSD